MGVHWKIPFLGKGGEGGGGAGGHKTPIYMGID